MKVLPYRAAHFSPALEAAFAEPRRTALKYSDDEPRDYHGRWTDATGGWTGPEPGKPEDAVDPRTRNTGMPTAEAGYLYHETTEDRLGPISREGLVPVPYVEYGSGDPQHFAATFFSHANNVGQSIIDRRRTAPDDETWYRNVLLRVPEGAVTERRDALGDVATSQRIAPDTIQVWGADGQWHPLRSGEIAKRATQVRLKSGGAERDRVLNPVLESLRRQLVALADEHGNRAALKYSEDQPRDDHGRWTSGGGDFGSLDGGKTPTNLAHLAEVQKWWDTTSVGAGTERGYTPAERDAVNRALAEYVKNSDVRVRVPTDVLYSIMGGEGDEQEGVLNQFQTKSGSSGGYIEDGMHLRSGVEDRQFFGREDVPADQRPVYGYLGNPKDAPAEWIGQYGDAVLVLKDDVKDRTSFVLGDSLDAGEAQAVPLSEAGKYGYLTNDYKINEYDAGHPATVYGYAETQTFGGIKPSDVDHVVFTREPPGAGTTYWLDHAGVPWTMAASAGGDPYANTEFQETGPVPVDPDSV